MRLEVASESLLADGEHTRGLLGCASASMRESVRRGAAGLETEAVEAVEASDATDIRSTSPTSTSGVSPRRALRRMEARVGLGRRAAEGLVVAAAAGVEVEEETPEGEPDVVLPLPALPGSALEPPDWACPPRPLEVAAAAAVAGG